MRPQSHATTTRPFKEICVGTARSNKQTNKNIVEACMLLFSLLYGCPGFKVDKIKDRALKFITDTLVSHGQIAFCHWVATVM